MSVAIAISFPAGRFHATPWGHHVNEGLPEWPPSPWRLLRALVATWKRKCAGESSVDAALPAVLAKLTAPPLIHLPAASLGHTRHYMPLRYPDQGDRTRVFDAFVALDPSAEVVFVWPEAALEPSEARALDRILGRLGFFGRAESWCQARLDPGSRDRGDGHWVDPEGSRETNCRPLASSPPALGTETETEAVRVLLPDPERWDQWSFGPKVGRPDPPWNVLAETSDLHAERWSSPPGSLRVPYLRRGDAFRAEARPRPARAARKRPTVARFALDAPALPLVEETLHVAEQLRRALIKVCGTPSRILSGKDERGQPLRDGHSHAFYLPTAESRGGLDRITHLTVFARDGFGDDEVRSLNSLRTLSWPPRIPTDPAFEPRRPRFGDGHLSLILTGLGTEDDFEDCPLFGHARVWRAATPYLAPRHLKRRGQKRDPEALLPMPENLEAFAWRLLAEEAALRGYPPPIRAESPEGPDPHRIGPRRLRALEFRRYRRKPNDDGGLRPSGIFRLRFPHPVPGPISLGHSCHFGLGLFLREDDGEDEDKAVT